MSELLMMHNIRKYFPGVKALRSVSLAIRGGEVHALIGENGAGKSTLMKILSGVYGMDEGEIFWDGKKVEISSTADATELGISIIYQELNQLPNMSVAENIFLGREKRTRNIFLNSRETFSEARKFLDNVGLDVDVRALCKDLSIAQRQMVEIAKALSVNARLIVMDEPTSSLTDKEITMLFGLIRRLREQGVAVVFISHKLEEIFQISDRITVLRDGEYIGTVETVDCSEDLLIQMMVGRSLTGFYPKREVPIGDVVLQVEHLNAGRSVRDVSFDVRAGEILGFAGLVGAGRSETMRALFGVDPMESGRIAVNGKTLSHHSPSDAIQCGIGLVPEDRKLQGLILKMTVRENTTLANMEATREKGFVSRRKEEQITREYVRKLDIRTAGTEQKAVNLSGGNQQKVVIAKWLATGSRVLILDSPTRGIDVGAKKEIHELMGELASQGAAIIMVSSELPEILGMCDRIIVMHEGSIRGDLKRSEATQEKIMEIILTSKKQAIPQGE
ncbi:MAG: sugar ABC transporter ATP-binding protein [Eubacteriales bacterium]|nr:sugar ABC transporter ATP-binding protein [Eubacteriales bacterium]